MPKVGRKKFAYTSAGRSAAKRYATRTGKRMVKEEKKKR